VLGFALNGLHGNIKDCYYCSCVKILQDPVGNLMLCNAGIDDCQPGLNVMDKEGHTALHLACLNGCEAVVKYLCACNADLEAWYVRI